VAATAMAAPKPPHASIPSRLFVSPRYFSSVCAAILPLKDDDLAEKGIDSIVLATL